MALTAHSFNSDKYLPGNALIGVAARGLEVEVGDLRNLANVTATIVDSALSDFNEPPTENEVNAVIYCVWELRKKIDDFHAAYYKAIEQRQDA